ncbi:MAG: RNA polymerase sigma factor [Blastocatellia bacterium]
MSADLPLPDLAQSIHSADRQLAERIRASDESAKDEFAARFSTLFRKFALRSGLPTQDAEDVAQQSLLLAYDRLLRGLFRGDSTLETWIYPVIRGQIIEHWRKHRRSERCNVSLENPLENSPEKDRLTLPELTLDSEWRTFEQWLDVVKALRALTDQERIILLLNRADRLSVRKIGELLDLPENVARKILYSAQESLRRHLCGYDFFSPTKSARARGARKRRALLLAANDGDAQGGANGRSTQSRSLSRFRPFTIFLRDWLLRAGNQRFTHGLLLWPCQH